MTSPWSLEILLGVLSVGALGGSFLLGYLLGVQRGKACLDAYILGQKALPPTGLPPSTPMQEGGPCWVKQQIHAHSLRGMPPKPPHVP